MAYCKALVVLVLLAGTCHAQDFSKVPAPVRPWAKFYASFTPKLDIEGEGGALAIAMSPDAKVLATAGPGKLVQLWDAAAGVKSASLAGHEDDVLAVAFSPSGRWLASCGKDKSVILWEAATGKLHARLGTHADEATCLAFSRDSSLLLSGGKDGAVRLWNIDAAKLERTYEDSSARRQNVNTHFTCVGFSPDTKQVIGGATAGRSMSWAITSTSPNSTSTSGGGGDCIAVGFTPSGGHRYTVMQTQAISFQPLNRLDSSGYASFNLTATGFAMAPNGKAFWVSGNRKLVLFPLWFEPPEEGKRSNNNLAAVTTLDVETADLRAIEMSSDGMRLVLLDVNGRIQFWGSDLPVPQEIESSVAELDEVFPPRAFAVNAIAGSHDGTMLAVATEDLLIRLRQGGQSSGALAGHTAPITQLAWSEKGDRLFSLDTGGKACVWDVARLRLVRQVQLPIGCKVACAPDVSMIAASSEGKVTLWDMVQGTDLQPLEDKGAAVDELGWSSDGEKIAVRRGKAIQIFATSNMKLESSLDVEGASAMAFESPGKYLRVVAAGKLVRVLTANGSVESEYLLMPEPDLIGSVVFSRNGLHVAWIDKDGTRIYGPDGKQKATMPGLKSWTAMAFEGEQRLMTGAADGRVRFWKVE